MAIVILPLYKARLAKAKAKTKAKTKALSRWFLVKTLFL